MKLFLVIIFATFILPAIVGAQIPGEQSSPTASGKDLLAALEKVTPENYLGQISQVRIDVENFLEKQNLYCSGELETSNGLGQAVKMKLNPTERTKCFEQLQEIHIQYVEKLFDIQKSYLNFLHENRMQEWEKAKDQMLQTIKSTKN